MNKVFSYLNNKLLNQHLSENKGHFVFQSEISFSYALALRFLENPENNIILAPNLYVAQNIYEELSLLIGEENCFLFPVDEVYVQNQYASSSEILSQRLYVLNSLFNNHKKIIITHPSSFNRYLPSPKLYQDNMLLIKKGENYSLDEIINKLSSLSFVRVNKIDQGLQFAVRGDILDIFPINEEKPIRIEFFDEEVESIRYFDIETQLSLKEIDEIKIFPSSDLLISKEDFLEAKTRILKKLNEDKNNLSSFLQDKLKKIVLSDLEYLQEHPLSEQYYKYYHYFFNDGYSFFSYLDIDNVFIYQYDQVLTAADIKKEDFRKYNQELYENGLALKEDSYDLDLFQAIRKYKNIIYTYSYYDTDEDNFTLDLKAVPFYAKNILATLDLIKAYLNKGYKVIICLDKKYLSSYEEFLSSHGQEYTYESIDNKVQLVEDDLKEGFICDDEKLLVLSKKEIFSYHQDLTIFSSRFKKAQIINTFDELKIGDYIVHEQNGIGQYQGVVTIKDANDELGDYLKILYAGNSVLYIPLAKFSTIRKYISQEGVKPRLSKLGGKDWSNVKSKIKQQVNYLAERLIALYAEREKIPGIPLKGDQELEKEFALAFPYELTRDQKTAINDIYSDMEKEHPMDRLLAGDVGFGKTEVAFRAAFRAIASGKQVALLCPTTILAKQHYEVASSRFSLFGIRIAMFSRFVPLSQQNNYIQEIKEGKIDLIIGTHRLLSSDIIIPKLGLLIIDEEQRFGVEHKERIKEISKNIDVLTLTATPIPRTLQMSLLGIRNLSTLNTPPHARMPIQTYVSPFSEALTKEVMARELARGGQVYYLFNSVSYINTKANKIKKLLPSARIGIVHAKMDKNDIDLVMNKFYSGEIDILVCTSIVEAGLDVPNANTIIIENADHFGLSQLYQIKGRVGRSTRVAYAYLFYNNEDNLTEVGKERLQAIKEFTELGSGIKIAEKDLSIRGCGDLLGPEQSGYINSLGMDMYIDILNEVISEKKGKSKEQKKILTTNISVGGYIPSSYALNSDKIALYQEIENCKSIKDIEIFRRKIRDIYGRIPKEVEKIILKRRIDILSSSDNIKSVYEDDDIVIVLSKEVTKKTGVARELNEKLSKYQKILSLKFNSQEITLKLKKSKDNIDALISILAFINTL